MFKTYFETLANCFRIPELRSRIWFTLFVLVICRLVALTPVPGLDGEVLLKAFDDLREAEANNPDGSSPNLLGLYSLFTGGALERCAIGSLGIMPYISATIILQLMTAVVPSLSKLSREEGGRTQIIKYGRYLTVLLCLGQGYVMSIGWENPGRVFQGLDLDGELVRDPGTWYRIQTMLMLTTGTVLLMWMGEQITERGVGNGVSLVITIGIIARLPQAAQSLWDMFAGQMVDGEMVSQFNMFHGFLLVGLLLGIVAAVIAMTQGQRKIPVQYAQRAVGRKMYQGGSSFLPLRVNYAGVMPIIFAQAILMFPQAIFQFLAGLPAVSSIDPQGNVTGGLLYSVFNTLSLKLAYGEPWFLVLEGSMIMFFSYFWVATQFNETQIADDLKKYGGYIPGQRPGAPTRDFLHHAMSRLTLAGAVFLVVIAIIPTIMSDQLNIPFAVSSFFGGTSILITVGVMLDTMRQLESHLMMRHYDGFLQKGKIRGR